MLNEHSKVGIAQIAFYVPAVTLATFLLFYRHGRPRMAWYLLFIFSLVRVLGGIIVILLENDPRSVGLTVATVILLGVGLIPLIVATIGLLRIILATDFEDKPLLRRVVTLSRVLFFVGVALLVAGGSFLGDYKSPSSVAMGKKLVKAGYLVVGIILAVLIAFQAYLWRNKIRLTTISVTILKGTSSAIPFLIVRITYAFLSVFDSYSFDSKWNDLDGSVTAFVVMALIMEYIVVAIYIGVGLIIPPIQYSKREREGASVSTFGQAGRPAEDYQG